MVVAIHSSVSDGYLPIVSRNIYVYGGSWQPIRIMGELKKHLH